jgi:hypothetical protein
VTKLEDGGDGSGDCVCGGRIASGRRDGFCSSWCRSRDEQGLPPQSPPPLFSSGTAPAPPTVLAPVEPSSTSSGGGSSPPAPEGGDDEPRRPRYRQRRRLIADEVEARIVAAGMADTWQAAAALDLADALDWQGGSGSARAALHKQLRDVMADLLRGQDEPGSRVGAMRDEVAERRARRTGGAGHGA